MTLSARWFGVHSRKKPSTLNEKSFFERTKFDERFVRSPRLSAFCSLDVAERARTGRLVFDARFAIVEICGSRE
jgi:hypothetical protein